MAKQIKFALFIVLCFAMITLMGVEIFAITQTVFEGNMSLSYSPIKVGDIVSYGEYPQTYVGASLNSTLLSRLNAGQLTTTGKTYPSYNYQTLTNYVEYSYNGSRYVYVPTAKFWDGSDDGGGYGDNSTFTTGDSAGAKINQGISCFFKVEPIQFRVMKANLNGGEITVESIKVLGSMAYNLGTASNAWASSNIKSYLNNGFLNSSGLKPIAKQVTNTNNVTNNYTSTGGASSSDYIWLPSINDLRSWYGSTDLTVGSSLSSLRKQLTDFATATYTRNISRYTYYGLRSAGNSNTAVCWVANGSPPKINANFGITGSDLGYAPAFVVNLR